MQRMQSRASVLLSVLVLLLVVAVLTYALAVQTFSLPSTNGPKIPATYETSSTTGTATEPTTVKQRTGILEQAVYSPDGDVLGTFYDAYINPRSGIIEWISVDTQKTSTAARLVLLSADMVQSFGKGDAPAVVNISRVALLDYPAQQKTEDKLQQHVSLRSLPNTFITDTNGIQVGVIRYATYNDSAITDIYFSKPNLDYAALDESQYFIIPFTALKYQRNETVGDDGKMKVYLSEKQVGAIEAYMVK